MTQKLKENFQIDKGGRRRIKDRRYRVSIVKTSDRRTGLKRRCGWDRRYKHLDIISVTNRRTGSVDPSTA
ncbi:MAG: hypothetical protein GY699_13255 [Desulfobacteraceae bacterium]|nr:hypothetical protein [Desulfobacteraceae bacterium]